MGTTEQKPGSSTSPVVETAPLFFADGSTAPMQVRRRRPARVYVASSWRNESRQQSMVATLRARGYEVYDFRHPAPGKHGFSWSEVDPDWRTWRPFDFRVGLKHPRAREAYHLDMGDLMDCDACVLVQPCGRSAHLELGWAVGARKVTVALLAPDQEAELMLAMVDVLAVSEGEVLAALARAGLEAGVLE